MKQFDVVLGMDGLWHIHKAGCQDVERIRRNRQANSIDRFNGQDVKDVVNQILNEEIRDMGYSENDIHILPCAR